MFRRILQTSSALAILTLGMTASASPFEPVMNRPKNFTDFQYGIDETRTNVASVQCGGWVNPPAEDDVTQSREFPIPTISAKNSDGSDDPIALPGRDNVNSLGNIQTGIGQRGFFQFPDSTSGFASACDMYLTSSGDILAIPPGPHTFPLTMHDDDLEQLGKDIYIHNTPCPPTAGADCIDLSDNGGSVGVQTPGTGEIQINPYGWCIRWDLATPKYCRRLKEAWDKMSTLPGIRKTVQENCDCESVSGIAHDPCPPRPPKRYCFDPVNTFECSGTSVRYGIEDVIMETARVSIPEGVSEAAWPFANIPRNTTCRTDWDPIALNKMTQCSYAVEIQPDGSPYAKLTVDVEGQHVMLPSSFYRHYAGGYMQPGVQVFYRRTIDGVTRTDVLGSLRAECYEYYKETNVDGSDFDPQSTVTAGFGDGGGRNNDEQCEVVLSNPTPEWPPLDGRSQKENVRGAENGFPDPPIDPVRDPRTSQDPWILDADTSLSIIDIEKLKEQQKAFDDPKDITGVVGSILEVKQRASKTVPKDVRTDMFDDSDHRSFSQYWEDQEKALLKLVRDPVTRLILPARFIAGLDTKNPLFTYVSKTVQKPNGTVELTLKSGPEDVGNVLSAFRESYTLPLNEIRIPILVPLTSQAEIDKLIFEWQQWKKDEDIAAYADPTNIRPSLSGEADPMIAKLQEYKTALLKQRTLRNALDKEMLTYLEPYKQIGIFMADWYKNNTQKLKDAAEASKGRRQLKRIWRHIQNSMLQADACQLQWCSNMRYSVAVYSLLDKWWGDAPLRSPRNTGYVPPDDLSDFAFDPPKDQLYDFSFLAPAKAEQKIPVLWPIQVKVKLPHPPLLGTHPEDLVNFPTLPDTGPILGEFASLTPPTVHLPDPRVLELPPAVDLEPAKDTLMKFRTMIDGTQLGDQILESEYEDANGGIVYDEGGGFSFDRNNMRGSYCRFVQSVLLPVDENKGSYDRIVHVENDLKERVARLYSRWLPNRPEDFAGRTERVRNQFPNPDQPPACNEDVICAFLPGKRTTTAKWQMFFPETSSDFSALATGIKLLTLPQDEEGNPYAKTTVLLLERLFIAPFTLELKPGS